MTWLGTLCYILSLPCIAICAIFLYVSLQEGIRLLEIVRTAVNVALAHPDAGKGAMLARCVNCFSSIRCVMVVKMELPMMITFTTFTRAHHEERISKGLRHSI